MVDERDGDLVGTKLCIEARHAAVLDPGRPGFARLAQHPQYAEPRIHKPFRQGRIEETTAIEMVGK
jgi:hypothetical protein